MTHKSWWSVEAKKVAICRVRCEAGIFLPFGIKSAIGDMRKASPTNDLLPSLVADMGRSGKKIPASQRTLKMATKYGSTVH